MGTHFNPDPQLFSQILQNLPQLDISATPISQIKAIQNKSEALLVTKNHNGKNWTKPNVNTLIVWLQMAMYQLNVLEESIVYYRNIVKYNIILGLILSTSSGTISATNINLNSANVNFILNIVFTSMSFIIAISTGFIKVYQIQENLENFIKIKQEWIIFTTGLLTEIQMPLEIRYDALLLIVNNKEKYSELLKQNLDIPYHILKKHLKPNTCRRWCCKKTRNCVYECMKKNNICQYQPPDVKIIIQKAVDLPSIIHNTIIQLQIEYKFLNDLVNKKELIHDTMHKQITYKINTNELFTTLPIQPATDFSGNIIDSSHNIVDLPPPIDSSAVCIPIRSLEETMDTYSVSKEHR